MARLKHKGVTLSGTLRKDGVAFYTRGGKVIMRSAKSEQPLRRTRGQFVARQRLAHNNTLWKRLRDAAEPMFAGSVTAYARFRTLMSKLPVVFLTKKEHENMASLLLEGMPVSDGFLQDLDYRLGEVEGEPALLTSVRMKSALPEGAEALDVAAALCGADADLQRGDRLRLYRLCQKEEEGVPKVYVTAEELLLDGDCGGTGFSGMALRCVDGRLALVGDEFLDEMWGWALVRISGHLALVGDEFLDAMMGWALVHISGEGCSSQTVATRCTLYEQYTTEEALARAAESYGGLTGVQ